MFCTAHARLEHNSTQQQQQQQHQQQQCSLARVAGQGFGLRARLREAGQGMGDSLPGMEAFRVEKNTASGGTETTGDSLPGMVASRFLYK